MTNIREVSRLAGVSTSTVSRTLKKPDVVSPKTKEKVLKAIEQAGYRPNLLARNFHSGMSYNVVVLVPSIANPFFSGVIRGIEQAAQDNGYAILLGDTQGDPAREQVYASMGLTRQADGLIQLDSRYPFAEEDRSIAASVPLVNACARISDDGDFPVVELDNRAAARAMTRHLVQLGHQRIAAITGPVDSPLTRDRLAGLQDALFEADITCDPDLVAHGDFSLASGYGAVELLLAVDKPPTAIFCFNDEMAMGAISRLKSLGLNVPGDISVAGFDDITFAAYSDPKLTTVNQSAEELGRQAMNTLYQLMQGKTLAVKRLMLSFDITVRDSTGPCKAQ